MTDLDRERLRAAGFTVPEPDRPLEHGSHLVSFEIEGRAVPWKAPHTTRTGHSFKDKSLVDWQERVHDEARLAMGDRPPYKFGVRLDLYFHLTPGGNVPDVSNLNKAAEDSLQGIDGVFLNDTQVIEIKGIRKFRNRNLVVIDVYAENEP